jgi:hypothetical protein
MLVFSNDHRTSRAKSTHHRCVARRGWRVGEHFGPRACGLTGDIEQVFDGNDRTIDRAETYADARSCVRRVGCIAGGFRIDSEAGPGPLTLRIGNSSESLF